MFRYLPIVLGILVIVGLTIPQILMSDRFASSNVSAEQRAELLNKVPKKIGDWLGEDMPVDNTVRQVAGAVGAVQREYRNIRTNERVNLWLIVGHARSISSHTPDVCFPASGFEQRAVENSLYPMEFPGVPKAEFWTNTFVKNDLTGRRLTRVFWSWCNPNVEANKGKVVWEAPGNARWHFGNTRALYKMYFTSEMREGSETAEQSACLRFAREFMPVVNEALADVHGAADAGKAAGSSDDAADAPAKDELADDSANQSVFPETGDATATEASETPEEPASVPAP
jgi:Protein of unknown function (DUF3485)